MTLPRCLKYPQQQSVYVRAAVSEAVKACNAEVDAVLNSISNPRRHTPVTVGGIKLSTADFKLLQPPHWLDDKVTSVL